VRVASGLLLLALLGVAGGWNYRRNAAAEAAEFRPYRGIASAELAQLIEAQEREHAEAERAWKRRGAAPAAHAGSSDLMQHVGDFERARRASERSQALGARMLAGEADLERMRRERAKRAEEGTGWRRVLHLATRL